jgi:hypothetical protein
VLHVISSSPGDLQPVFDTILGNATRLCEASYAGMWLCNGDRLRFVAQHGGILPETDFAQLRASSGEHRLVNINALVEEALNLAYHGARAEQPDFAITLQGQSPVKVTSRL